MADNDRFLSRWSRRKLAEKQREETPAPAMVREQGNAEAPADPPEPAEELSQEAQSDAQSRESQSPEQLSDEDQSAAELSSEDQSDDEPPRHPAEDIDLDSLTKESDFTIFMHKGVPTALRRKALRKLWTSDPVLANLDGLNDYEDMEWTYGISDVANTEWKLGRGFLTDKDLGLASEPEDETESDEESGTDAEIELEEIAEDSNEADPTAVTPEEPAEGFVEVAELPEDRAGDPEPVSTPANDGPVKPA